MTLFGEEDTAAAAPKESPTAAVVRELVALGVPRDTVRTYGRKQAMAVLASMKKKRARDTAAETAPAYEPVRPEREYKRLAPEVDDTLAELRADIVDPARLSPLGLWGACMMLEQKDLPDLARWIEERLNATRGRLAPRTRESGLEGGDFRDGIGGDYEPVEIDPRDADYLRSLNESAEEIPA